MSNIVNGGAMHGGIHWLCGRCLISLPLIPSLSHRAEDSSSYANVYSWAAAVAACSGLTEPWEITSLTGVNLLVISPTCILENCHLNQSTLWIPACRWALIKHKEVCDRHRFSGSWEDVWESSAYWTIDQGLWAVNGPWFVFIQYGQLVLFLELHLWTKIG